MEKLRVHQRWMALPWGGFGIAIALVFAAVGVYSLIMYPEEEPSVRVAIPMYALALYWVVALLCNRRTAVVTAQGVRVSVWPFLVGPPRRVKHDNIRHCYIRKITTYDDGTVLESYYSVGVEAIDGEQIDMSQPHNTAEEAMLLANQVADVLNQSPGRNPIEVRQVAQMPERPEVLRILVLASLWLALFIAAVFVGFAWEEERVRARRASLQSGCSIPDCAVPPYCAVKWCEQPWAAAYVGGDHNVPGPMSNGPLRHLKGWEEAGVDLLPPTWGDLAQALRYHP